MTVGQTAAIERYAANDLRAFVTGVLERLAVPSVDAALAANALHAADITGVDSHGVARFAGHPSYVPGLRRRLVNPRPGSRIVSEAPSTALIDGDDGMGVVIASRAMDVAIRKAFETGVGLVTVTNSRHFGIAAHYARMALPHGMIGIAMTNACPQVALPGSVGALLGTNPIAVAAPTGTGAPFVLDMATSVGAAGKAEIARRAGKTMPKGWLVDAEGRPTIDPEVLFGGLGGALMPLGSSDDTAAHKGYGLAMVVDILCGVLSGAGHSAALDPEPWECGHFLGAIRVDAFRPLGGFVDGMAAMFRTFRTAKRADGIAPFKIHGEIEAATRADREARGVPLHPAVVAELKTLVPEFSIPFPEPIHR
ncbi:MAG: Ldh family oxidoreductase [Chloroflexota bacterium]|nr:MAG: Ldh family oxidoreductase [Chloroflexota bacterium]